MMKYVPADCRGEEAAAWKKSYGAYWREVIDSGLS